MPTFTMRLSDKDDAALQAVVLLTGTTKSEIVRQSIRDMITRYLASGELAQDARAAAEAAEMTLRAWKPS